MDGGNDVVNDDGLMCGCGEGVAEGSGSAFF